MKLTMTMTMKLTLKLNLKLNLTMAMTKKLTLKLTLTLAPIQETYGGHGGGNAAGGEWCAAVRHGSHEQSTAVVSGCGWMMVASDVCCRMVRVRVGTG